MFKPHVSLVVPIHNEAARAWSSTIALRAQMRSLGESYEIILVENGSLDDTALVAEALAARFRDVLTATLPEASLGEALKLGFRRATGDKIIYYPLDLSVDLDFIPRSLGLLEDFDIVVASKRRGKDGRPLLRRLTSVAYHGLVRWIFGTNLSDTTCAKAYRRGALTGLLDGLPGGSRVFETELLVEAERRGLRIAELPVGVVETRRSRESLLSKVESKLEDLLSARLDRLALFTGAPIMLAGAVWLAVLGIEKLGVPTAGFMNPYSFMTAILLVLTGFQIAAFGLLSRLILQVRGEVTRSRALDELNEPPVGDAQEEHQRHRD